MIESVAIGRSAGDILSRTVRITLGGKEYVLPVLSIAGNRRWMEQVDRELGHVLRSLREAKGDTVGLHAVLSGQIDQMLDLIASYDTTGLLPSKDVLLETVYEIELLDAVQEVWRAANPLVAIALARMERTRMSGSSELTSSSPPNTAGPRKRSKRN